MPPRDARARVEDILAAIAKIVRYTEGMTFGEFSVDDRTVDAVARNLEIIGEAARHVVVDVRQAEAGIPWTEITGMRNFLIHQYAEVSLSTIWQTIQQDLPPLEEALQRWLRNTGSA